jgi:hypothetical protein
MDGSVSVEDADELFVILSDPAGRWYQPAGRHPNVPATIGFCGWIGAKPGLLTFWLCLVTYLSRSRP